METKKITSKRISLLIFAVIFNLNLFSQTLPFNIAQPCTVAVKEIVSPLKDIHLYPNPVINILKINFSDETGSLPLSFTIFDALGKEILKGNYLKNDGIDVTNLKNGFYLFKALDKDKNLYQRKFLKL